MYKETTNVTDVILKMKVLEESVNGFMKQNCEQLQVLTDTIANSRAPSTLRNPATRMENAETPGTKKRKMNDLETGNGHMDGITPISMNFVEASKKNHPQQENSQPQNYQQQHQRTIQNQQRTYPHPQPPRRWHPHFFFTYFI